MAEPTMKGKRSVPKMASGLSGAFSNITSGIKKLSDKRYYGRF